MLTLIDNYDSFTYNLLHRLGEVGARDMRVYRNDEKPAADILAENPRAIVLSPGPCTPDTAGVCLELCTQAEVPLLGVCLGYQSLAQAFGGRVIRASEQWHGKTSVIRHNGQGLFRGLSNNISVTRYHSLIVEAASLPKDFIIDATTNIHAGNGEDNAEILMAIRHRHKPLYGLQFHPESIATPDGFALLRNFLENHQLLHAT